MDFRSMPTSSFFFIQRKSCLPANSERHGKCDGILRTKKERLVLQVSL